LAVCRNAVHNGCCPCVNHDLSGTNNSFNTRYFSGYARINPNLPDFAVSRNAGGESFCARINPNLPDFAVSRHTYNKSTSARAANNLPDFAVAFNANDFGNNRHTCDNLADKAFGFYTGNGCRGACVYFYYTRIPTSKYASDVDVSIGVYDKHPDTAHGGYSSYTCNCFPLDSNISNKTKCKNAVREGASTRINVDLVYLGCGSYAGNRKQCRSNNVNLVDFACGGNAYNRCIRRGCNNNSANSPCALNTCNRELTANTNLNLIDRACGSNT
jgi:hypothetical protein